MPTFTTDNRWSPGASGATIPEDATAIYSARWIDHGDYSPADIPGSRQGFAYNDPADRDALIALLSNEGSNMRRTPNNSGLDKRDVSTVIENTPEWAMYQRRSGGYIYVDAFLKAAK